MEIKRLTIGKVYENGQSCAFVEKRTFQDRSNKTVTTYEVWGRSNKYDLNTILKTLEDTFSAKVFIESFLDNSRLKGI